MARKNRPIGTEPTGRNAQPVHDDALFEHVRAEIDRRRQTPRIDQRVKEWLTSGDNPYITRVQWRQATHKLARVAAAGAIAATLFGAPLAKPPVVQAASITVTTTNDELNTDGDCSLREAITAANTNSSYDACAAGEDGERDVITLPSGTITLSDGALPTINDADGLDIVGQGAGVSTIDANEIDRILDVSGASLSISGVTLTNGRATGKGGQGGAISVSNGELTLTDSEITDSTAGVFGGAIFAYNSDLTLTDSEITDSTARVGGAIVVIADTDDASLTIANSTLSGNEAGGDGGAIYAYASGNSSNEATITVDISDSTISDNTASSSNDGYGGALNVYGTDNSNASVTIDNTTIRNNQAYGSGGVDVTSAYTDEDTLFTVTITDSTFEQNMASDNKGGGLGLWNWGNSTFNAHISRSTFSGNEADNVSHGGGGGIFVYSEAYNGSPTTDVTIEESTFSSNRGRYGGAIYHWSYGYNSDNAVTSTVTIQNSLFSENTALGGGGAIENFAKAYPYSTYVPTATANLVIADSIFSENTAGGDGGVIQNWATAYYYYDVTNDYYGTANANVSISGSTFSGNQADGDGGAIFSYTDDYYGYGYQNATVSIVNSTFSGNQANGNGGAIYNYEYQGNYAPSEATMTIDNSTIIGNIADDNDVGNDYGGGIASNYGTVTLTNTIIGGNTLGDSSTDNVFDFGGDGTVNGANYNLVGNLTGLTGGGTLGSDSSSDITFTDADLGNILDTTLADNGSTIMAGDPNGEHRLVQTHRVLPGSVAVNAGDPDFAAPPDTDQRGFARVTDGRVDIGAVESGQPFGFEVGNQDDGTPVANETGEVDFGTTSAGTPITRTIVVTNTGDAGDITFDGITLPDGYSLMDGPDFPHTVGAWETDSFVVQLDAELGGVYTGTLAFDMTDPAGDPYPYEFALTGEVLAPDIAVLYNSAVLSTTSTVDFGMTNVGEPITRTLTISNTGGVTLTVDSATVPAGFSLGSTLPMTIAASSAMTLDVRLDAEANGFYTGEMMLSSNDPAESTSYFNISGQVGEAIGDLTASAVSSTTIQLDWTDLSDAETEFQIERSLDGVTGWTSPMTVTMNTTTYTDTGLNPATTYYYRMRGANTTAGTLSDYTDVVSATTAPDLRVSMTCELAGRSVMCTVNYANDSSAPVSLAEFVGSAENVQLTMTTPDGAAYDDNNSGADWTQVDATTSYTTSIGALAAGETGTTTFTADLDPTVPLSSSLQFQVSISGNTGGAVGSSSSSQSSVELTAPGFDVFLPLIQRSGAATTGQAELDAEQTSRWQRVAAWFSRVTRNIV